MSSLLILVFIHLVCGGFASIYGGSYGSLAMSDEKRLTKHLVENYEKVGLVGRPVYNTSESVSYSFGVGLHQILDFDEKTEVLTMKISETSTWMDILLQWSASDFGEVEGVTVPLSSIWVPDITLLNRIKKSEILSQELAQVSSRGEIFTERITVVETPCNADLTNFPFDEQTCELVYGLVNFDNTKVVLDLYQGRELMDTSEYIRSSEWQLVGNIAVRKTRQQHGKWYNSLFFTLTIRRNSAFYLFVLVFPSVLTSFLTILLFLMPPNVSDRNNYAIGIFAAFFLLLLIVAEVMPKGLVTVPKFGQYLIANLILVTFAMFLGNYIAYLHSLPKSKPVPKFVQKALCSKISRIVCLCSRDENSKDNPDCLVCEDEEPGKQSGLPRLTHVNNQVDKGTTWIMFAKFLDRICVIVYFWLQLLFIFVFIFMPSQVASY